jgi:hypothetical protein
VLRLCAARYSAEDRTVRLEKREQIKQRLGRSPDLADAVVMALWDDPKALRAALVRAQVWPDPAVTRRGRPDRRDAA